MRNIWKRSEVDPAASYCFVLYQSESGVRDYGICRSEQMDTIQRGNDFAAITGVVPIDFVLRGDVFSIADEVPLSDGARFFLDSDAVWYMQDEWDDLLHERKNIRWTGGIPPKRKPRYA